MLGLYALCESKNKFVYEVSPGLYGGERLTVEELELWTCYHIISRARLHEVEFEALPIEEVIRLTDEAERKKRQKYAKGTAGSRKAK